MKKHILRLVLVSLFAISVGVAGVVFADIAWAGQLAPCPHCNQVTLDCVGSTCTCNWDGQGYVCQVVR